MQQIKKYFSVFFLLLFMFPFVETQLHAFEHKDDVHCVSSDKHFHEQEHSCSICDFNCTSYKIPLLSDEQIILHESSFIYFEYANSLPDIGIVGFSNPRAPPVILL